MPNDGSTQSPMIAKAGAESDAGGSATTAEQAQAMRARLGAQRENEKLLAEASELKRAAADEADAIVAAAETLADRLVSEARESAEALATEARERADGIVARSRIEADELQRHTEAERARIREEVLATGRAEIEEFRARSAGLLDEAEGGLRQLGPSLEGAVSTVVEVLRSLEELRNGGTSESKPAALERVADPTEADTSADSAEAMIAEGAPSTGLDDPDARPLGWLFRASQG
jgi:vacuolar-type H+-ATPase subunit H